MRNLNGRPCKSFKLLLESSLLTSHWKSHPDKWERKLPPALSGPTAISPHKGSEAGKGRLCRPCLQSPTKHVRYLRKHHRNKGHLIGESPSLLDERVPSIAFWGTHKNVFPRCQLKNASSCGYLQMYSSSLALSSNPCDVFTVLSDCCFPLSAMLLSTVWSLPPDTISAPRHFQLSLAPQDPTLSPWTPELAELTMSKRMPPLSPFLVHFLQGIPTATWPVSSVSPGIF